MFSQRCVKLKSINGNQIKALECCILNIIIILKNGEISLITKVTEYKSGKLKKIIRNALF